MGTAPDNTARTTRHAIRVGPLRLGGGGPLFLIAGPCVIEDPRETLKVAKALKEAANALGLPYVFKTSYDKANRQAGTSYRGPGLSAGLKVLARVRREVDVPVLTDVHTVEEVRAAARVVDILQIPAFLCRQTDLVVAAAKTGRPVNLKKGQFLAPWDMGPILDKAAATGNRNLLVTERGTTFGYNNLVSDMRSLAALAEFGYPVVYDATHSVQQPGGRGTSSGGQRGMVPVLARAAVAAGCDGIFLEVHPEPERAKSDSATQLPLADAPALLETLVRIRRAVTA
jgi:2-dehydro-3-deoxyphosphooctonate aldolase (KDO 8-P synthase)